MRNASAPEKLTASGVYTSVRTGSHITVSATKSPGALRSTKTFRHAQSCGLNVLCTICCFTTFLGLYDVKPKQTSTLSSSDISACVKYRIDVYVELHPELTKRREALKTT